MDWVNFGPAGHIIQIYLKTYILSSVCLRLIKILSVTFTQYIGWAIQLIASLSMILRIFVLYLIIIIKSEIWFISHI